MTLKLCFRIHTCIQLCNYFYIGIDIGIGIGIGVANSNGIAIILKIDSVLSVDRETEKEVKYVLIFNLNNLFLVIVL